MEGNKKISRKQKEILVSFMEDNLDIARGRLHTADERITFRNQWLTLVKQLNDIGKHKTVPQWQRTWTDIKIKVKRKLKASRMKTEDGSMTDTKISDFDDRVFKIIFKDAIFGIEYSECTSLESENSRTDTKILDDNILIVAGPSTLKHNSPEGTFTSNADLEQNIELEETAHKRRKLDLGCSMPSQSPVSEIDEDETASTPRRQNQINDSAVTTEDLRIISQETNENISTLKNEIAKLNDKIEVIIDQNNAVMVHRVQTNNLLERIAMALEGQTL